MNTLPRAARCGGFLHSGVGDERVDGVDNVVPGGAQVADVVCRGDFSDINISQQRCEKLIGFKIDIHFGRDGLLSEWN